MYTEQDKDFLRKLKYQGYSMEKAFAELQKYKNEQVQETPGTLSNVGTGLKDYAVGVGKDITESAKGFKDMSSGVFKRAQDRFSKAIEIGQTTSNINTGYDKLDNILNPAMQFIEGGVAGGLATTGTVFDTAFTAGLELLKIVAPEKVEEVVKGGMQKITPTLQSLDTKIKDFAKTSPEAKKLVDKAGLVLEGFIYPGVGSAGIKAAQKGIESTIKTGKETTQRVIQSSPIINSQNFIKDLIKNQEMLKNSKEKIIDIGANIGENINKRVERLKTGIEKEKIAGLQSNPYQATEFNKLIQRLDSPEGIADIKDYKTERIGAITKQLIDKIDEIRATKGEISQAYKDIKTLPIQVKVDDLLDNLKTSFEKNGMSFDKDGNLNRVPGSKAKDLNTYDIAKFQQLYNDIKADAVKGHLTPDEILTFRKTASDLAKYDGSTTTTGQGIMRAIRKDIDNTAKMQIPGLKELDAQFVDKLDEFENAIKDLVYKGGDVKGEWRSNIVNIIGTLDRQNRAKLLERLEDVMPGIGEQIKAIDNLPSIYKAINNKGMLEKFTGVGGAVAGGATLGAVVPGLGHIIGFVLGYVGGELLENVITSARRVAINNVLSKISPEGFKKMKEIDLKIKNNEMLKKGDKEFINNLKIKLDNETNNIETRKTKDINNSMGNNMTTNTDELLTIRMADSSINNTKSIKEAKKSLPKKSDLQNTLKSLNSNNIDEVSKTLAKQLNTSKIKEIKAVITKYIKEFGKDIKNYLGLLVDDIVDKKPLKKIETLPKDVDILEESKKFKNITNLIKKD